MNPEKIIAYYTVPLDPDDSWEWADAATEAWIAAAAAASLRVEVASYEVRGDKDAAIVEVEGQRYLLTVPDARPVDVGGPRPSNRKTQYIDMREPDEMEVRATLHED